MARKELDGDDGRTIAPMNIDGMPWYDGAPKRHHKGADDEDQAKQPKQPPLTKGETRRVVSGAVMAALGVALFFAVGGAVFLLILFWAWGLF